MPNLIEPHIFEIASIDSVAAKLDELCDPAMLRPALHALAVKVRFRPLAGPAKKSRETLNDSIDIAEALLEAAANVLRFYIGANPFYAAQRAEILNDFLITKSEFKKRHGVDYDAVPDKTRAVMHLFNAAQFAESTILQFVSIHAGQPLQSLHADTRDGVKIPFSRHPELFGAFYAYHKFLELVTGEDARLNSLPAPAVAAAKNEVMDDMVENLARPIRERKIKRFPTPHAAHLN